MWIPLASLVAGLVIAFGLWAVNVVSHPRPDRYCNLRDPQPRKPFSNGCLEDEYDKLHRLRIRYIEEASKSHDDSLG